MRTHLVVLQPFYPGNGISRLFSLFLRRLFVLYTPHDTVHLFQDKHGPVELVAGRIGVLKEGENRASAIVKLFPTEA